MKKTSLLLVLIFGFILDNQAQNFKFNQDFESLETGTNVAKGPNRKFSSWGKATWSVTEEKGKGNKKSDKFVSSDGVSNAALVLHKDLEVGQTYVFKVAVKVTNANGVAWKTNYSVKATSGKKPDLFEYGDDSVKEPGEDNWRTHKIVFTVVEGRERVALQVFRWAEGVTLNIDDFYLKKLF